jgi:tetratricopeptide (TPR) repeat protein
MDTEEGYDSFLREAARVTDAAAVVSARPMAEGTRLAGGRFELLRTLGQGGMGVVYAARDHVRGGEVALKTLQAATLDALERLRAEFVTLHDLSHPNLVSLGELTEDDGRWFFTMELVNGPDFLGYTRPDGVLDAGRLRAAAAQLVTGLGFLHAAGKVHRDIKPSNVLVADGRVVLLDFGLAAQSGRDGIGAGTLGYMAPEQAAGGTVSPAADWYAFGAMLWEVLAGRLPFVGPPSEILTGKREGAPPLPADVPDADGDVGRLVVALLDPDPARRPDGAEVARVCGITAPPRSPMPRFVGRVPERAALSERFASSRHTSRAVLVRGPSGIGKSALVNAFAADARDAGALVLADRCYERIAVPFKGLHGVAAELAAHLGEDRDAREAALDGPDLGLLIAALPALAVNGELARAGRGTAQVRDPIERRGRVFDAFAGLLGRLGKLRPLVLVIDDVQWADRDGLALLDHAMARVERGLFVVSTAADGADVDAAWSALAESIVVGPLARDDAAALGAALSGGDVMALVDEAAGHPLHLAELVALRRTGAATMRLEDAIAARVRELAPVPSRLLELVALAGAPLPQSLLAGAAGLDGAAWWSALGALRSAHLVRTRGAGAADAVEPYHDRVRHSVASAVASDARREIHLRLASAIESHELAKDRPGLLADHLEQAGETQRALAFVEAAARQAEEALAFERAADLYRRALTLGGDHPRAALEERLGEACAAVGRGAEAASAFLAAAAASEGVTATDLRRRAAEQLLRSGRIDEGIALMDRVLDEAGLPTLGERRHPVAAVVGQRARLWWRRRRAAASAERAERTSAETALRLACCWSAVVGSSMVSPLRGAEFQARHLRLALDAGDARRIALGLAFEAGGAAIVGPPATRAHAILDEAAEWAARVDQPIVRAYLDLARGSVAFLCGEWLEALARCEACERTLRDECVGAAWEVGTAQRMSLTCLWHTGRIAELRQRLRLAVEEAGQRNDIYAAIQMGTVLTPAVCLMDDRPDDAVAELKVAEGRLPRHGVTMLHWQHMQAQALVAIYRGDAAAAVALIEREKPALRRGHLFRVRAVRVFTAYVEAAALLGAAARTGGTEGAALRWRAREIRRELTQRNDNTAAGALIDAELAVLEGDEQRAERRYRRAIDGFALGDMHLIATSARWRLGELIGGDEGRRLRTDAESALRAEGIRDPARAVSLFVPVSSSASSSTAPA